MPQDKFFVYDEYIDCHHVERYKTGILQSTNTVLYVLLV